MQKQYLLLVTFFTLYLFAFSQTNTLSHLLSDISKSKIVTGNTIEENYHSLNTQSEFDKYLYNLKESQSDTINSIALIKENEIKGVLIGCRGCYYYNSVVLTSDNPLLPHSAKSTKYDGLINVAKFINKNAQSFSVGDENGDKTIDYVAYSIGKGLIAVLTFNKSLTSPAMFLLYNSNSKEYAGIITFKILNNEKIFDRGYIKNIDGWDAFNLKDKNSDFVTSMKDVDILKGKLPNFDEIEKTPISSPDSNISKEKEIEFISLLKTTYGATLKNWLGDYNLVVNSKVIGARFPEIIVLSK